MISFFKKKKIIPLIRLSGVIGSVGKFKQGIDFAGQEEIIKKAFAQKKSPAVAISINSITFTLLGSEPPMNTPRVELEHDAI